MSSVTFVIKDNGRGFDPSINEGTADNSRIDSGHGLRNLVQRLEAIGGSCSIQSAPGSGTVVELSLLLKKPVAQSHEDH